MAHMRKKNELVALGRCVGVRAIPSVCVAVFLPSPVSEISKGGVSKTARDEDAQREMSYRLCFKTHASVYIASCTERCLLLAGTPCQVDGLAGSLFVLVFSVVVDCRSPPPNTITNTQYFYSYHTQLPVISFPFI